MKRILGLEIAVLLSFLVVEQPCINTHKRRKYKEIIGSSISEDDQNYRVFLSDKNKTNFISFNFSFQDGTNTSKEFKLKPGDRFIQTVTTYLDQNML